METDGDGDFDGGGDIFMMSQGKSQLIIRVFEKKNNKKTKGFPSRFSRVSNLPNPFMINDFKKMLFHLATLGTQNERRNI